MIVLGGQKNKNIWVVMFLFGILVLIRLFIYFIVVVVVVVVVFMFEKNTDKSHTTYTHKNSMTGRM